MFLERYFSLPLFVHPSSKTHKKRKKEKKKDLKGKRDINRDQ